MRLLYNVVNLYSFLEKTKDLMLTLLLISLYNLLYRLKNDYDVRTNNPIVQKLLASPRTIVITRFQHLGDTAVILPVIKALRNAYPSALIYILVRQNTGAELLKGCPWHNGLIILKGNTFRDKLTVFRTLRKIGIDLFIISTQEYGKLPWALLTNARCIIAYKKVLLGSEEKKEKLPWLISIPVKFNPELHETERNLELLRAIGINITNSEINVDWINKSDKDYVIRLLSENGISKDSSFAIAAPFSKRPAKMWPPERFQQVIQYLVKEYSLKVIIIGGKEDKSIINYLINSLHNDVIDLTGKTTILQLVFLIKMSKLMIAVDSGPAHLAVAGKTPVVVLFGPGEVEKWNPGWNNSPNKYIYNKLPCAPCREYDCEKHNRMCMNSITVNNVVNNIETMLNYKRSIN
ncbi:MAG: glycosyltransferase family 9 protein [Nitrospirae bacterium]|nr:glycosyltransferase family 9 protein [Nitrospirota bacterium]